MDSPTMCFPLPPSRLLFAGLCIVHALSLGALPASGLSNAARLVLAALVLGSLARLCAAWRAARNGAPAVLAYGARGWCLEERGEVREVSLDASSALLPFVLVLRARCGRRVRTLLATRDALGSERFRQLSVLLRLRGGGEG